MEVFVNPQLLVGFSLALTRAAAWVTFCPPFNGPAIPVRVRIGMAVEAYFEPFGDDLAIPKFRPKP